MKVSNPFRRYSARSGLLLTLHRCSYSTIQSVGEEVNMMRNKQRWCENFTPSLINNF